MAQTSKDLDSQEIWAVNERSYEILKKIAVIITSIVGLSATISLLGWFAESVELVPTGSRAPSTKPTTALCLILGAVSLWLLRKPPAQRSKSATLISRISAAVLAAIPLAALIDLLFDSRTVLSGWLLGNPLNWGGKEIDTTLSVNAIFSLMLIGVGIALISYDRFPSASQWAGVIAAAIAFTGAIGNLAGESSAGSIESLLRMNSIAAIEMTLLAIGLTLFQANQGWLSMLISDSPGGVLVRRLLPIVFIALPTIAFLRWWGEARGLYGSAMGVVVIYLSVLFIVTIVSWLAARRVNESEKKRKFASDEIDHYFNISLELLAISGDNGYFTRLNPAWERTLGYTVEELCAQPYVNFVHPDDLGSTFEAARALSEGHQVVRFENRYRHKDGGYRWLVWNVAPNPENGMVYGAASDITERKENERLLAEARDTALEAMEVKSQFLATMSHEIRTPMNGVIGLTGLLRESDLNDQQRRHVETIHSAGETLMKVINNILDFSKLENGGVNLEVIDFSPALLVEDVVQIVAQPAQEKGLELISWCDPNFPMLRGDPARIRQVLLNLASNAVKFTEEGEVIIQAEILPHSSATNGNGAHGNGNKARSADTVWMRFAVEDTGIGISAIDAERLFEPFTQADASTTRRYGGTGLGLAISRRLIQAMGGTLEMSPRIEGGSKFWCEIPLIRMPEGATKPTVQPHLLKGRKVLVVDDNETNRTILEYHLRVWGMLPRSFASGPEALMELERMRQVGESYDLGVLDHHMPEMSGIDLANEIASTQSIPLVLLTSGGIVDLDGARSAHIEATLTKPTRHSDLYDCMVRLLSRTASVAASAAAEYEAPNSTNQVPPAETISAEQTAPASLAHSKGHVLIVEDTEINQIVMLELLSHLGFTADVASDGIEALSKTAENAYQVVFMDCQMPRMDGYEATAEIRRRENGSVHLPIVAMTAAALPEDRKRCLDAGMDDYVAKPIDLPHLEAMLQRWINGAPKTAPIPVRKSTVVGNEIEERLNELFGTATGDRSIRLLNSLLEQISTSMRDLDAAVANEDLERIDFVAHGLKGAASMLGAHHLAEASSHVQRAAVASDAQSLSLALSNLRREAEYASEAVTNFLEIGSANGEAKNSQ